MHAKPEWAHAVRLSVAQAQSSRRDPGLGPDESPKGTGTTDRFADQGRGRGGRKVHAGCTGWPRDRAQGSAGGRGPVHSQYQE